MKRQVRRDPSAHGASRLRYHRKARRMCPKRLAQRDLRIRHDECVSEGDSDTRVLTGHDDGTVCAGFPF